MPALEWSQSVSLVPYLEALAAMETRVASIRMISEPELVWLLEHPPLYTAGTSACITDLIEPEKFPVYQAGRGGQFTYHGPGQRIAYVMIDLAKRQKDVRAYVRALEQWLIDTLSLLGVQGERREGRVGIWVATPHGDEKIAAIGVRLRQWVSFHGIALNVTPNLDHFSGIVPCGLANFGVTSLHKLGISIAMPDLDALLQQTWQKNEFLSVIDIKP